MEQTNQYYNKIINRNLIHFVIGLIPRFKQWVKHNRSRRLARKKGAMIGDDSIILPDLVKKANTNLKIGDNTSIGSYKLDTRSPVIIGNNVIISDYSEIITTSHYVDSPEWEHKYYGIEIEDYVWIASNVLILPSCRKIGYGAVIGAGSVVVKDVEPMSIIGGNPAVHLRERKCVHDKLVIPSLLSGDLKIYWETWINKRK